jgi:uncharacterized membrane protein (UPF0127 family)
LKRSLFFLLLVFLFPVPGCTGPPRTASVQFGGADRPKSPEIEIEIARTPAERGVGLMYRKTLAEHHGMLFIFENEAPRSFWMKNTYLELDLVFLDSKLRVVSIFRRAKPLSETSCPSEGPAMYVLEIGGGLSDKWNITKGDELRILSGQELITR